MRRPGCRSASRCVRLESLVADDAPSAAPFRARRVALRLRAARMLGRDEIELKAQLEAMAPALGEPFHRCLLELEAARSQPVDRALAAFERVLAENLTRERPGLTLHAAARAAHAALALGDLERAGRHLAAVRALPETCAPFDIDRSELWLLVARVMQATGDVAGAAALIGRSAQWVRSTAAQLPAEWRDAFLRRHPANAGLLAAAAALPPG